MKVGLEMGESFKRYRTKDVKERFETVSPAFFHSINKNLQRKYAF